MRSIAILILTMLCLALPGSNICYGAQEAAGNTSEFTDSRLDRTITIKKGRIYLGELMEELTKQTQVRFTVSQTRGPVDGIELIVYLKDRPAREAMKALTTLFSQKADMWEWRRSKGNASGYELYHERTPGDASAANRQRILTAFADSLRELYRVSKLNEDGRKLRMQARPDLSHKGYYDPGTLDLLATLRPNDVEALIGGSIVGLDLARTTVRGQGALTFGMTGQPPVPEELRSTPAFLMNWTTQFMGPVLWLRNETGGGVNVAGAQAWDSDWLGREAKSWWIRGVPAVELQRDRMLRRDPLCGILFSVDTYAEWLKIAAEKQNLNIIADMVFPSHLRPGNLACLGSTQTQTVMSMVVGSEGLARKSGETYVFRDRTAYVHPRGHLVSWAFIQQLRKRADKNEGCMGIVDFQRLTELNIDQLGALSEEFPNANAELILPWKPIFEFWSHSPREQQTRITSRDGFPIRDSGLVARNALAANGDPQRLLGLEFLSRMFDSATVSLIRQEPVVFPNGTRAKYASLNWLIRAGAEEHRQQFNLIPRRTLQPD